jgi:hypothetical protein
VTILPQPRIISVSPASFTTGAFTLTVNGEGFVAGAVVKVDGVSLATTVVSSAKLTATGTAAAAKPGVPVVATMPDGSMSNTLLVTITATPAAPVSISISPSSASVRVRRTRQFTANVQGTSNKAVSWKVNGVTGGNASVGTISQGFYVAPASVPSGGKVTVSATSAADPTKTASAAVTITRR